eukprot:4495166-Amphidinium_carterae.1
MEEQIRRNDPMLEHGISSEHSQRNACCPNEISHMGASPQLCGNWVSIMLCSWMLDVLAGRYFHICLARRSLPGQVHSLAAKHANKLANQPTANNQ